MAESDMMNSYTPVETKEYASKGVAGSALGLAIGGLSAALLGNGALPGILGGRPMPPPPDFLPRTEAALMQQLADKNSEIARMAAQEFAVAKIDELRRDLTNKIDTNKDIQTAVNMQQTALNATQSAAIACAQQSIQQILGSFRLMLPNGNVAPGWGPAYVTPIPPVTVTNNGTANTTSSAANG